MLLAGHHVCETTLERFGGHGDGRSVGRDWNIWDVKWRGGWKSCYAVEKGEREEWVYLPGDMVLSAFFHVSSSIRTYSCVSMAVAMSCFGHVKVYGDK